MRLVEQILHLTDELHTVVTSSSIWGFATKTTLRLIVCTVGVFAAAMVVMVGSVFLFFSRPFLAVVGCAVFGVLMIMVSLLAREGRRRENRK